jgi:glycosyltransferase involved in cell wall biosynthesis
MRILLWHGYLLSGSGSNVYTINVAKAWRRQGHDVLVMCQERHPERFPGIDAAVTFDTGNRTLDLPAIEGGSFVLARPDIDGLLPVYVYDEYEGFEVKRFVDLTDDELDRYTSLNVTALQSALDAFSPDAVVTGHEVMGPYIAHVACRGSVHGYAAKLHGSALEYAVKLQDRYLRFATEGLGGARTVVGGSRYMLEEAARTIPGWEHKSTVVNPGVDVELFEPVQGTRQGPPTVGFVGKLIAEKGVQNLIAALGHTTVEGLRAVIVGYGGDEAPMRALASSLSAGDLDGASEVARSLSHADPLLAYLDRVGDDYAARAREISIEFTGRLEHDPLSRVLPTFDLLVVPSVIAEAFGMVAAEAAACGVLPLVPDHSGIAEAGEAVEQHLERPGFLTYDSSNPVEEIAAGIDRILGVDGEQRREMGLASAGLARRLWSWDHVAERLLAAAV